MLTIRKKLAEQASSGSRASRDGGVSRNRVTRKLSFRSKLLTAEANELGGVIPGKKNVWIDPVFIYSYLETCRVHFPNPDDLCNFQLVINPGKPHL